MLHVSLDVDFLDPGVAPGVGTTVPGGATFREAHLVMEMLHDAGRVTSLDLVELNPFLDERGRTALLMVDLVASLMGFILGPFSVGAFNDLFAASMGEDAIVVSMAIASSSADFNRRTARSIPKSSRSSGRASVRRRHRLSIPNAWPACGPRSAAPVARDRGRVYQALQSVALSGVLAKG